MKLNGSILLVDDELSILNSLQRIFLTEGYKVYTANSGHEGIKVLESQPVDIIISDMRMPVMDGAAFLKIAVERWHDTKRVLLTGYSDIASAITAVNEAKIHYYLEKPWKNDQVIKISNNLLENKLLQDQNRALQNRLNIQNEELKILNNNLEERVQERTEELHKSYQELEDTHTSAIQVFLSMKELHEGAYKDYSRSVANHAKLLAQSMQLNDKEIQTIYLAGMLHNLGKSALPEEIRYKPFTKLAKEEHKEFIQYPVIGATVLETFPSLQEVASIILRHRERFDGRGYPYRLKGDSITLLPSILAIAVDYNELQQGLIFPEQYTAKLALQFIKEHQERYAPNLALLFINTIKEIPDEQKSLAEVELGPYQLKPGMILSRDLISKNGFVFLTKGYSLKKEIIERIQEMGNFVVYIYKDTINK